MSQNKPTKCEIIRRGMQTSACGGCSGNTTPPPECQIFAAAGAASLRRAATYNPNGIFGTEKLERPIYLSSAKAGEAAALKALNEGFGTDIKELQWSEMTQCRWNPTPSGSAVGGPNNHRFISRDDLVGVGYVPRPVLGGSVTGNKNRPNGPFNSLISNSKLNFVPIWLDTYIPPTISFVVIIIFILLAVMATIDFLLQEHGDPVSRKKVRDEAKRDDEILAKAAALTASARNPRRSRHTQQVLRNS
jgi:hypothetical protein